jgi:uncharacterized protein YerC
MKDLNGVYPRVSIDVISVLDMYFRGGLKAYWWKVMPICSGGYTLQQVDAYFGVSYATVSRALEA